MNTATKIVVTRCDYFPVIKHKRLKIAYYVCCLNACKGRWIEVDGGKQF